MDHQQDEIDALRSLARRQENLLVDQREALAERDRLIAALRVRVAALQQQIDGRAWLAQAVRNAN